MVKSFEQARGPLLSLSFFPTIPLVPLTYFLFLFYFFLSLYLTLIVQINLYYWLGHMVSSAPKLGQKHLLIIRLLQHGPCMRIRQNSNFWAWRKEDSHSWCICSVWGEVIKHLQLSFYSSLNLSRFNSILSDSHIWSVSYFCNYWI